MIYTITTEPREVNFHPTNVVEEILQNVYTILTTAEYSVPLDRKFGINSTYLDNPSAVAKAKLIADVIEKVHQYEERVIVEEVSFREDQIAGKLNPVVKLQIKEGVL